MLALLDTRPTQGFEPPVQSIGLEAPGKTFIHSYPQQALQAGQFRVTTRYSGISSSETALIGGAALQGFAWRTLAAPRNQPYPILSLGHMEVGQVSASRSPRVKEGQWVALAYGHKTAHTVQTPDDFYVELGTLKPILGIFVAQVGPGCVYRLLQASHGQVATDLHKLKGATVGIVGERAEALLCGLLASHFGAEVEVVSASQACRQTAAAFGLESAEAFRVRPQIEVDLRCQPFSSTSTLPWNPWRKDNRQDLVDITLEVLHHSASAIEQYLISHRIPASRGLGFMQTLGSCDRVIQAVLEYPD